MVPVSVARWALRRARLAERLVRANLGRLATPLKVNLCLTYWCQYRCKTCNIWLRKPTDELSTAELSRFVQKNTEVSWLDVTGGEIFLRKDAGDFLAEVATTWRRLAVLHFPTNGFQTDTIVKAVERIARLKSGAELVVTVSVDGDESLNDEIRGIRGGFRHQMRTFNRLRQIPGVRVVLGMTLSRYNADALEKTFRACESACPGLRGGDFHVNVAQVSGHYYGNEGEAERLVPDRGMVVDALRRYRALAGMALSLRGQLERAYLRGLVRYLDTGRTPMRCHALRSSCFVDPWGTVYPCITWDRPVGSLRDHGMALGGVWASREAASLQGEIWNGNCPQCWTACEAYQSILGNLLRRRDGGARARPPGVPG